MIKDINIRQELGKRIKEKRKSMGMTQSQLCSEYMTRNMLSRIETGDAYPSLDTLLFIAHKLKTPPAFFLCRDAKEEAEYTKTVRIKDARRFLGTGQFKKCIDICSELPSDDDEVSFITVNAEIMSAIQDFDKGQLDDSRIHLDKAMTALHQTVYMYSEMQSQIKYLHILINSLSEGELPLPSSLPRMAPSFFSKDRYLYITSLSLSKEEGDSSSLTSAISADSIYRGHLEAKKQIAKGNYSLAKEQLEKVVTEAQDSFTQYFALCDLEKACRLSDDYKSAYSYSQKRIELHDKYKK